MSAPVFIHADDGSVVNLAFATQLRRVGGAGSFAVQALMLNGVTVPVHHCATAWEADERIAALLAEVRRQAGPTLAEARDAVERFEAERRRFLAQPTLPVEAASA